MTNANAHRTHSPGRGRQARIDYKLSEHAVHMNVRPEVREARELVRSTCTAEILGLRGPQWDASTQPHPSLVARSKYTRATSDESLANTLPASALNPRDARTLKPGHLQPYDRQRFHAFDRGAATTSWDFGTTLGERQMRSWQRDLDKRSQQATKHRAQQLLQRSVSYVPPVEREARFAASMAQAKQAEATRRADLEQRYGPAGAEVMAQIQGMRQRTQWRRIRATPDDLAAVRQLPGLGDGGSDDGGGSAAEATPSGPDPAA